MSKELGIKVEAVNMKHYIKTQDGVYEPILGRETDIAICCLKHGYIFKKDIIKESDSIKELCDGDVLFEDGQLKKVHYYKEGFGFNEYGSKLSANQFVVLFIVTDKGLIFVAKMNSNGDLELL